MFSLQTWLNVCLNCNVFSAKKWEKKDFWIPQNSFCKPNRLLFKIIVKHYNNGSMIFLHK